MTNEEKCRYVARKYPKSRLKRSVAYWHLLIEFYGQDWGDFAKNTIQTPLMAFFKDYASLERAWREILKEDEFKLEPEQDAKIKEREAEFRESLSPKEQKDFDYMFNPKK